MSKTKEWYMNEEKNKNNGGCDCAYNKNEYTVWRKFLAMIGFISLITFVPYILWSVSALNTMSLLCLQ